MSDRTAFSFALPNSSASSRAARSVLNLEEDKEEKVSSSSAVDSSRIACALLGGHRTVISVNCIAARWWYVQFEREFRSCKMTPE